MGTRPPPSLIFSGCLGGVAMDVLLRMSAQNYVAVRTSENFSCCVDIL
jgi:hypothetical protein